MRIAIVTGHFMPEIGYQEVYLARALAKKGHDVRVFTSTAISPTGKKIRQTDYEEGLTRNETYNYEVLRLKPTMARGAKVYSRKLKKNLDAWKPDMALCVAVSKYWPYQIFKKPQAYKTVAIFGDADEYINIKRGVFKLKYVLYKLSFYVLKAYIYNLAWKNADKVVCNLPETRGFIQKLISKSTYEKAAPKVNELYLGFDANDFFFDQEGRDRLRNQYDLSDSLALITVTRINPQKRLERIIDLADKVMSEGVKLKYFIIGLQNDEYGEQFKRYVQSKENSENFEVLPFMSHSEVRSYLSMSDYGFWMQAAISIQEAMGTGLKVIIPKTLSLNHLVLEGQNGYYYGPDSMIEDLPAILKKAEIGSRDEVAKINEKYAYDNLCELVIA
ncbi:glycosyltransferase family 4 protein [Schleiferiaceae bacterium]|nr:glycosyltransferase family 4 protein [Schleiferiaceae bacterium]